MKPRAILAGILLLAMSLPRAGAGTIHWAHTPGIERETSTLRPYLTLRQTGDEAAREVRAEFEFTGLFRPSRLLPVAPQGTDFELRPDTPFPLPVRPGWHPVAYRLRYVDGNGYPFSTVLVLLERFGVEPTRAPPAIAIPPTSITIGRSGRGVVRATNQGDGDLSLTVELLLPSEFRRVAPDAGERIDLPAGSTVEIPVSLEEAGALPGSRYNAYLLLEGEDGEGEHVAAAGILDIAVVAPAETFERWRPGLVAILVLALGGLAISFFRAWSSRA